jgi:hypothetical protein
MLQKEELHCVLWLEVFCQQTLQPYRYILHVRNWRPLYLHYMEQYILQLKPNHETGMFKY